MQVMPQDPDLLERIERYYDAAPRSSARTEEVGGLTLFVPTDSPYPFYARPTLRPGTVTKVTPHDVATVLGRQRTLGVAQELEWVEETTPSLLPVAEAAGLQVGRYPLMVLDQPVAAASVTGTDVRVLDADAADLPDVEAAIHVAFMNAGLDVGDAGTEARDELRASIDDATIAYQRRRIRDGRTVMVAARTADGVVGGGSHRPVGEVTELVGIGVLPAARRAGAGAAITARLVAEARGRGASTVFLSAGSDDVARTYARVGFRRVATACIATAPADPA